MKHLKDYSENDIIDYSEYVANCVNQLIDKNTPLKIDKYDYENKSLWSRLKPEAKISIIIGIIELILSFITLITR